MTIESKYSRIHTCNLCGYNFSSEESSEHIIVSEANSEKLEFDFYLCPCCNSRVLKYPFMIFGGYSYGF